MTHSETVITRVLRSRGMALLLTIAAAAGSYASLPNAPEVPWQGVWLEGARMFAPGMAPWGASLLAALVVAAAMTGINRVFNLLRTMSVSFIGFFMVMQAATPGGLGSFGPGQILAPAMMAVMALLLGVYQNPDGTRPIFLAFFILGLGAAAASVGFIPFILVALAGLSVMRVFRPRPLAAALVGIVAGPWIMWGFGWICITHPIAPDFTADASDLLRPDRLPAIAATVVTLLGALCMGCANSYRMLRLNARSRDNYTLLSLIGIAAGVLLIADFTRWQAYSTLLNCCTAMQMTLFLRAFASSRAYIAVLFMLLAYIICFALPFII